MLLDKLTCFSTVSESLEVWCLVAMASWICLTVVDLLMKKSMRLETLMGGFAAGVSALAAVTADTSLVTSGASSTFRVIIGNI